MKKINKIFFLVFLLIVIIFFLIVLWNQDYFYSVINFYIEDYGYASVFVLSFIADLLEQPIGPEVISSIAVLFELNVFFIFIFSWVGSSFSSLVNFYIGKHLLSEKFKSSCSIEGHGKYCKMFEKYGDLALFIAAISPVPYVMFCWLSGVFHMKFRNFFLYGMIPRAFRIGIVILIVRLGLFGF